jgi:hypothetical protein
MSDYYSVIAGAISRLPSKTDEARHAIYQRARTAIQEKLGNYDPPLSEIALANEQIALEAAISRLEADLSFSNLPRGAKQAIWRYVLGLIAGAAFAAGLAALIHTKRVYQSPAASQSEITTQPGFSTKTGRESSGFARAPDFRNPLP